MLNASWTAIYDVRVDMQAPTNPVTIIYKAAITQDTAEVGTNASCNVKLC